MVGVQTYQFGMKLKTLPTSASEMWASASDATSIADMLIDEHEAERNTD